MAICHDDNAIQAVQRQRRLLADTLYEPEVVPDIWLPDGTRVSATVPRSILRVLLTDYCWSVPPIDALCPFGGREAEEETAAVWHALVKAGVIVLTNDANEATVVNLSALEPFRDRHRKLICAEREAKKAWEARRRAKHANWRGITGDALAHIPRGWVVYLIRQDSEKPLKWPGVYVVYCDGVLMYVGSSANVSQRILDHRIRCNLTDSEPETPWGRFKNVVVKVKYSRRCGEWLMREHRLIARLQPPQNTAGTRRPRT